MDDVTNEIISLLDDAERLLPVAHGKEFFHYFRANFWQYVL